MGIISCIRRATAYDSSMIIQVMDQIKRQIADPDWFVAENDEFLEAHAKSHQGFIVVAEVDDGTLAGFFLVDYPGNQSNNLGFDLGFPPVLQGQVAHMDTVAVLPEYRGQGLMRRMLCYVEEELKQTTYHHLLCTIHPDNFYSLEQMKRSGYEVVMTKEKYGGLKRHILYKQQIFCPPRILVSACLLGVKCRYNGTGEFHKTIVELMSQMTLIPVCPETLGGLPTPRDPSERVGEQVITKHGIDVTIPYKEGAKELYRLGQLYQCKAAILKERSPSCGSGEIYDGTFTKSLVKGDGVGAAYLKGHGIPVFGESKILELKYFIETTTKL